jgi:hypothetical protein
MIQEMLEVDIIQPRQSDLFSLVVMVTKKDGSWCICLYYRQINKMTTKDKFIIPTIDELLYELQGTIYFTKLDPCYRYHQIIMRQEDIPRKSFRIHGGHYEF